MSDGLRLAENAVIMSTYGVVSYPPSVTTDAFEISFRPTRCATIITAGHNTPLARFCSNEFHYAESTTENT
jgi:hypothetical protein